jgi:hypothetical protein
MLELTKTLDRIEDSIIEDELMLRGVRIGNSLTIKGTNVSNAEKIDIGFSDLNNLIIL